MAMYFYASKISAIACGSRCKQSVLQKSRGQRDRDKAKFQHRCHHSSSSESEASLDEACCDISATQPDLSVISIDVANPILHSNLPLGFELGNEQLRLRRRHSAEQLSAQDLEQGFQQFESSVLGSGGIMYINGRIVSGPLESFTEVLIPKHVIDLDKEFLFSFLLCSRLFLRPHELLGKLLDSVPESGCLEALVALLSEWTQKFPYDYRDERMMNHVKHIVVRCSHTHLEAIVSQVLSALLNRLTDLERHEGDLRACQTNNDKVAAPLKCLTATQYAQILCRLEKKLAKHIGPEEFLQCSNLVLMDKQKKWDQPVTATGSQGAQDPKKTCNLETYLDWSSRLRLFVCNEILQCSGIEERSRTVELWSGVAQYCLLVGNYNSATAILESLESPAIARLKVTWSKLQVTCQQLDCMQRHAEGHGHLWQKQAIVLNEQQQLKTDKQASLLSSSKETVDEATAAATTITTSSSSGQHKLDGEISSISGMNTIATPNEDLPQIMMAVAATSGKVPPTTITETATETPTSTATKARASTRTSSGKPNDWVVIPVFADIVKLALGERENCLHRLPNGHIDINAFDRMAAIVGAFTKHMQAMKSTQTPSGDEYEHFCSHMQQTTKLAEAELMMASFECEEPNNAEKLMYDLN
ncbi:ras-GEF domain-containing family member 1B-like isoform X2 [Drosophila sulfurigaster albostrigata]|uniref:ras-GEF domain-containing family member 1B-like isoform X2 n=1 Tax=Drosophila sulfurigaster albostrigata TaxID=89887 RepID=UPI002D2198B3|nr:ras-GEF domain-containing family member 1B-like isoform X2 [Drosophila sulfurigaster albostrigata]